MTTTEHVPSGTRRAARRCILTAFAVLAALSGTAPRASAQVRERPAALDSSGRVMSISPPMAARIGLSPPLWPAEGDYIDARLYVTDDATGDAVLVVRRQHDVLDRFPITAAQRREIARAIERATVRSSRGLRSEELSTEISEPVRGAYVLNQALLGGFLFAPAAAALAGDAAGGTAAALLVTGGTFFLAAERTKNGAVSRAQNHLAWHGARQGAGAAYLATYALVGEDADSKGFAAATLVGGVVGDILGDRLARPMTDAEAHGVSHGGVFIPALLAGALGTAGLSDDEGNRRASAALVLGAQLAGYPLGMRYVRGTRYRVTAGDVGTLIAGEAVGLAAAASFIGEDGTSNEVGSALVTGGFLLGAIVADRAFVLPFDYTVSESRLLQLGTLAGGIAALAVPVAAQANGPQPYFAAATVGGLLGAVLTHRLLEPARAGTSGAAIRRTGARAALSRFDVDFTPQTLLIASTGARGSYPVLHVGF